MPLLLAAALAVAGDSIHALGLDWDVPVAADWNLDGGALQLLVPRPSTQPRRPTQYALARTAPYRKLTLEFEVKKEPAEARSRRTSVMIVYAWRGPDHFNYAHLSVDTGKQQPVHNGIFHVYGGDRVRISSEEGPPTLKDESWHKVKLVYDADSGRVDVWVNGATSPSMAAVDLSLKAGRFGIGSFFDMGSFRNLKVTGEIAR
ncbi:MAG: hypothetical protein FJW39_25005 [Acidobacteria bacterium]|nr:hypothetical protein [Acidobacteriota bacterium]